MEQAKVLDIVSKSAIVNEPRKIPRWKTFLLILGFMKHEHEPQVNGTALVFAVLFGLSVIYQFFGGTVNFVDQMDEKRGENMVDKTTVRRANDKLTKEQEKRAQLLEIHKKDGTYESLPESLKIFEQPEQIKEK